MRSCSGLTAALLHPSATPPTKAAWNIFHVSNISNRKPHQILSLQPARVGVRCVLRQCQIGRACSLLTAIHEPVSLASAAPAYQHLSYLSQHVEGQGRVGPKEGRAQARQAHFSNLTGHFHCSPQTLLPLTPPLFLQHGRLPVRIVVVRVRRAGGRCRSLGGGYCDVGRGWRCRLRWCFIVSSRRRRCSDPARACSRASPPGSGLRKGEVSRLQ